METILNLIWLAVTLAALWEWRFRWAASRRDSRCDVRQETIAIVCLLALLFPVISLSDDLHPDIVPADTASSKRMHCLLVAHAVHGGSAKSHSGTQSSFALLSKFPFEVDPVSAGVLHSVQVSSSISSSFSSSGRSPPSLS
jgi:hypothetical protein